MRYENIELNLSTVACDALLKALESTKTGPWGYHVNAEANAELHNLSNELRARLQRRDADVQCPKNLETALPDNLDLVGGIEL